MEIEELLTFSKAARKLSDLEPMELRDNARKLRALVAELPRGGEGYKEVPSAHEGLTTSFHGRTILQEIADQQEELADAVDTLRELIE